MFHLEGYMCAWSIFLIKMLVYFECVLLGHAKKKKKKKTDGTMFISS